jgi:mono/diheme cytochrome c family protein
MPSEITPDPSGSRTPCAGTAFALRRSQEERSVVTDMFKSVLVIAVMVGAPMQAAAQNAQVQQGEQVYAAQKCAMCHSIAGKGNSKGPLDHVGTKLSAEDIRNWMLDAPGMTAKTKALRKPAMKSYPQLAKADLDALVAYVQSLK